MTCLDISDGFVGLGGARSSEARILARGDWGMDEKAETEKNDKK